MSRFVFGTVLAGVALVGVGLVVLRSPRPRNPEPPTSAVAERPSTAADAPRAAPSGPPPPPASSRRAPPRRASPAASAAAAPAEKRPETGTLQIVSDIPGAQVFLDRQFVGVTPFTAEDVAPGSHNLNISVPGYDAHVETIDVLPGAREIAVKFREVRLSAAIDVLHKHRMGSCKGRLVATPRGIRYETTDTDDVFSSPLLELDVLQIDYVSKNLRIQPRGGKRYDFTDPDGNADRLFVFHRDVERARERLKKGDVPAGQ